MSEPTTPAPDEPFFIPMDDRQAWDNGQYWGIHGTEPDYDEDPIEDNE